MAFNTKFPIILAAFVTFSKAQWNTNDYMKREHSLIKPYQGKFVNDFILGFFKNLLLSALGTGFGIANWDFQGSTMVTSTHVRLTPNEQSKQGAIWNAQVKDEFDFGLESSIPIHP